MTEAFGKNWWVLVVQGVLAILFGAGAILMPGLTLVTLVAIFGATAMLDGVTALVGAFTVSSADAPRWLFVVRGLVGIVAGVAVFAWPGVTALLLIFIIAARFVITGVMEIIAAIGLRKEIDGEWLMVVSGILSVVAGIWLFAAPGAGAVALAWLIGCFALLIGATLVGAGFRLRGVRNRVQPTERTSPA